MKNCFKNLALMVALFTASSVAFANNDKESESASNGDVIVVEAEDFDRQTMLERRSWVIKEIRTSPEQAYIISEASGKCFMEASPDTRVTDSSKVWPQENVSDVPGTVAVMYYKVKFDKPGKYYVWASIYSMGDHDRSMHVGINDYWPESGKGMIWCDGKNSWTWGNSKYTEANKCGEPHGIYIEVSKAGEHEVAFSMRDDGVKFDRFILTTDKNYVPAN